jgi:hypothetical protein
MPAVEVLLNTKLVSELIEKGDFGRQGSDGEVDGRRLADLRGGHRPPDQEGTISRDEGLAHADSPTNLLWRLQNEAGARRLAEKEEGDPATFTEITLDVVPRLRAPPRPAFLRLTAWRPTRDDRRPGHAAPAEALIARRSVTPDDAGCQALLPSGWPQPALPAKPCPAGPTTSASPTCGRCAAAPARAHPGAGRPHRRGAHRPAGAPGPATPSCPPTATAGSTAAAPPT